MPSNSIIRTIKKRKIVKVIKVVKKAKTGTTKLHTIIEEPEMTNLS